MPSSNRGGIRMFSSTVCQLGESCRLCSSRDGKPVVTDSSTCASLGLPGLNDNGRCFGGGIEYAPTVSLLRRSNKAPKSSNAFTRMGTGYSGR
jgi:hypothetical protein